MGLSLRRLGKSIWEGITPQNEEALRRAEANLARSNQAMARPAQYGVLRNQQYQQQAIQNNQPQRFNLGKAAIQSGGSALGEMGSALGEMYAGGIKRFGQDVAGTVLTPYSNRLAEQEKERAKRLLTPSYENMYRAYGADPRLGANQADIEANMADYDIRTEPLRRSNIGVNDSVLKKVTAHAVEAGLDIGTAGTGPAAFKAGKAGVKAAKPSIAAGAALGAAGNLAYTAGQDGASPLDYVVSGGTGAAIGATLPALTGLAGRTSAGPTIKADKPKVSMKPPKQGLTPQELQVRELNKSIQTQEKLAKNATTPRTQERHLKAKDALIKERAVLNRLTKPFKEEDGFARLPGKQDPLESLKQEARKYKSAEEFVNSQANLMHGTKADFTEFDPSLLGTNTGAPSAKKGFFFTDTPEIANHYANPGRNYGTAISKNLEDAFSRISNRAKAEGLDNSLSNNNGAAMIVGSWPKVAPGTPKESVIKAVIDKMDNLKARFDSPSDIAKIERYKQLAQEELSNTPITELEMFGKVMKSKVDFKNPLVIDDRGFRNGASYAQRIDEAIAKGHDGVIIKNTQDPLRGNIYVALNKNQILTEKQLTDLYNQATQSQPPKSKLGLKKLDEVGSIRLGKESADNPLESLKQEATTYYHGSTNDKLTSLQPGAKTGLNEKRNLIYLTDDVETAKPYTKNRGTDGSGQGVLTDSKTGKVYEVQVEGKTIGAYDFEELAKLKNAKGFNELSGRTKNSITNDTGLSAEVLEANPELRNFLTQNGYTNVKAHLPNGTGKSSEIIVLDPSKAKLSQPPKSPLKSAGGEQSFRGNTKELAETLSEDLKGKTVVIETDAGPVTGKVRSNYTGQIRTAEQTTNGVASTNHWNEGGAVFVEMPDGTAMKVPTRQVNGLKILNDTPSATQSVPKPQVDNGYVKVTMPDGSTNYIPKSQLTAKSKSPLTVEKTKPKVALKEKPAVSPQAPSTKRGQVDSSLNNTPPSMYTQGALEAASEPKGKKIVVPNRSTDDAIREVSGLSGLEIGVPNQKLGLQNKLMSAATGGKVKNVRGANLFRSTADAAGEALNTQAEKAITGKGSKSLNASRSLMGGTGLADETRQIARVHEGQNANIAEATKRIWAEADNTISEQGDEARKLLELTMRDQKYIDRVYPGQKKLAPEKLPPELKNVYDKATAVNKVTNDLNYQTGVITADQWKAGTKGQHIARVFDIPHGEKGAIRDHLRTMFENTASIKRKDISKMADETIELLERDPVRAIYLRNEIALRNKSFLEAMDGYSSRKFIQKSKPNDGFVKLEGNRYGKYNGQYMERGVLEQLTGNRVFTNQLAESFDNFINGYKATPIGGMDRLQKAFKTTMAPGTIVGNISSNPLIFNPGAGTNPITQIVDMIGAARQMTKGVSDGDVYLARQLGVIGGDSGRLLTGSASQGTGVIKKQGGVIKKVLDTTGRFYGNIDDTAKLGLWNRLRKQGVDPQKAAVEVSKFTQDYNNVGRTISLIADTPVLGKPFARFSPELVRIIKNNVTRAPHRIIAGVAGLAYIANKLSEDAGETDEERKAREGQVGQTKIPGTAWINKAMGGPDSDVSLNLAVGDSAVNVARSMGLNFPIEPGTDPNRALVEQLIPIEIPVTKNALGEDQFDPTKVVTSMTLRPVVEQIFDRNFMGRKVSDPTNVIYDSEGRVTKLTPPSLKENLKNRGRALSTSYLPLGNEIDSLYSAVAGKPTALGKERTPAQAVGRMFGIKAEKNDAETRKKRLDTSEYFEVTKKAESDFLSQNKDLQDLYFQVFPKTKDRTTGVKVSDQISPEKWARVDSEKTGRLFNFMRSQAIEANKLSVEKSRRDSSMPIQPVDPIYKLPDNQAREALKLRSQYTGDDIEREQILRATQPWFVKLEKDERQYFDDNKKYFDALKKSGVDTDSSQNPRAREWSNVAYPEQPPLLKEYYALKEKNPEAAKQFLKSKNKDFVNSQFQADADARLNYINAKRKIEGAPPISKDVYNNVTFGYEDDEEKVATKLYFKGKEEGWGRGSGGGSKKSNISSVAKYAIDPDVGGKAPKASISVKGPTKVGVAKKTSGKPKVSIRKSLV